MSSNKTIIYHNNRCTKSREALVILQESGCELEIREYLKEVPTHEEIDGLLTALKLTAIDIIRKSEPAYKNNFQGKIMSNSEWIDVMVANPVLIERPIVIRNGFAVIGRPPVLVLDVLAEQ